MLITMRPPRTAPLIIVVAFLLLAQPGPVEPAPVTILRDGYGVPHISSPTLAGLFYGFGYATAEDRLFQMDMVRRTYWGRLSEVHGPRFFNLDLSMRRDNPTRRELRREVQALPKEHRVVLRSFAEGINAFIEEALRSPGLLLPREFRSFEIAPELWEPEDVVALFLAVMTSFMQLSKELENETFLDYLVKRHGAENGRAIFSDMTWGDDPSATTTVRYSGGGRMKREGAKGFDGLSDTTGLGTAGSNLPVSDAPANELFSYHGEFPTASYALVVGPRRSASASPLLMAGPQFGWLLPSALYEARLQGPGVNVAGVTVAGFPLIMFGQSTTTAFASTAGAGNVTDYFLERLRPGQPGQYLYKGRWRTMRWRTETIHVKGGPSREVTLRYTVHGPVVRPDTEKGVAYAKSSAWRNAPLSGYSAYYEAMKAKTPAAYVKALSQGSLSTNHFYADTSGNIAYYQQGRYPRRHPKTDARFPTPGTGGRDWLGFLPPSAHPMTVNPKSQFIANWNTKPAAGWSSGDPRGILGGPVGWGMDQRVRIIEDFVTSRETISVGDLRQLIREISSAHLSAERFKPFLLQAVARQERMSPGVRQAADLLSRWNDRWQDDDGDGLYDHPGIAIFNVWWETVLRNTFQEPLGDYWVYLAEGRGGGYRWEVRHRHYGNPVLLRALLGRDSPYPLSRDYFRGRRDEILASSLEEALAVLERHFKTPDMTLWRLAVTPMQFHPQTLHGVPTTAAKVGQLPVMERGSANVIIELPREGARGIAVLPPGQSCFTGIDGRKGNHFEDQMDLFGSFTYRPIGTGQSGPRDHSGTRRELTRVGR